MIYYETVCRYCKKTFKLFDNTRQYADYKRNPNGKYSCDTCRRNVETDARKYLFNRH